MIENLVYEHLKKAVKKEVGRHLGRPLTCTYELFLGEEVDRAIVYMINTNDHHSLCPKFYLYLRTHKEDLNKVKKWMSLSQEFSTFFDKSINKNPHKDLQTICVKAYKLWKKKIWKNVFYSLREPLENFRSR